VLATDAWGVMTETNSGANFSDFYRDNYRQLISQAFILVGNLSDAQELVQESLFKTWRRWDEPPPLEDPGKWVRLVMHRQAVASWRRREVSRRFLHRFARSEQVPNMSAEHLEVAEATRALPPNQRRALVLQAVVGMSVEEIAAEMSVPDSTVRTWLSRARRRIAEQLRVEDTFGDTSVDEPEGNQL
jgi:RNA polymerase sigma-70 factor, ECF subfamily